MNWQRPKEKPSSQTEVLQTLKLYERDMVFAQTSAGGIQRFSVNEVFSQRGKLDVFPILLNGTVDRETTGGVPISIKARDVVAVLRNRVWNITEAGQQLGINLESLDKILTPPAPSLVDVEQGKFRAKRKVREVILRELGRSTR